MTVSPDKQIKTILGEEANALAAWLTDPKNGKLPHRVEIALSREIERLRELARYPDVGLENSFSAEPPQ